MKKLFFGSIAIAAVMSAPLTSFANNPGDTDYDCVNSVFNEIDSSGTDGISSDEWAASIYSSIDFGTLDRNDDGKISLGEFTYAVENSIIGVNCQGST